VAAVHADIQTSKHSALNIKVFGVLADRSSVGFLKAINIADTINAETNEYNFRKLDIDRYQTMGAEARWLLHYRLGVNEAHLAAGMRYSDAHTHRLVDGLGTTGSAFDAALASGNFGKDLHYDNVNVAYFLENIFHVTPKFKITLGVRLEQLQSKSSGYISSTAGEFAPIERSRVIPLAGLGMSYEIASTTFYANFSQAYRPVTYSDLTPAGTTDIIDPNLKDASGFNADAGWRGCMGRIVNVDAGVFYLQYDNRIGVVQRDGVNFKTNIGASVSKGVEIFAETFPLKAFSGHWSAFISGAWMDARYTRWENPLIADDPTLSIADKCIEYAPQQSCKAGLDYKRNRVSARAQWTYVGEVFTDAANTTTPTANAQIGLLTAYSLLDASMKLYLSEALHMQLSMNNVLNTRYATRRAGGYPGPGLLPGTGRTLTLSLNLTM
jgi:Fe(3+) dicitrate transport protein